MENIALNGEQFKHKTLDFEEDSIKLSHIISAYKTKIAYLRDEQRKKAKERAIESEKRKREVQKRLENLLDDLNEFKKRNYSPLIRDFLKESKTGFQQVLGSSIIICVIILIFVAAFEIIKPHADLDKEIMVYLNNVQGKSENVINELQEHLDAKLYEIDSRTIANLEKQRGGTEIVINSSYNTIDQLNKVNAKTLIVEKGITIIESNENLLEKIVLAIKEYEQEHSLKDKNDIRISYKFHLDRYFPVNYSLIRHAIMDYDSKSKYVPSIEDMQIWDNQMLEINKRMLAKVRALVSDVVPFHMRKFENYKRRDATNYGDLFHKSYEKNELIRDIETAVKRITMQIALNKDV